MDGNNASAQLVKYNRRRRCAHNCHVERTKISRMPRVESKFGTSTPAQLTPKTCRASQPPVATANRSSAGMMPRSFHELLDKVSTLRGRDGSERTTKASDLSESSTSESTVMAVFGAASPCPPWLRPEGPTPRAPSSGPRPVPVDTPLERVLIGTGPGGAEARLTIGHGPLAGSQVHLRHGPAGIEATVLTQTESSRQTLSVAMVEVARRLERRGYVLRTAEEAPRSDSDRRQQERRR